MFVDTKTILVSCFLILLSSNPEEYLILTSCQGASWRMAALWQLRQCYQSNYLMRSVIEHVCANAAREKNSLKTVKWLYFKTPSSLNCLHIARFHSIYVPATNRLGLVVWRQNTRQETGKYSVYVESVLTNSRLLRTVFNVSIFFFFFFNSVYVYNEIRL